VGLGSWCVGVIIFRIADGAVASARFYLQPSSTRAQTSK
jgi:hypothetical protein